MSRLASVVLIMAASASPQVAPAQSNAPQAARTSSVDSLLWSAYRSAFAVPRQAVSAGADTHLVDLVAARQQLATQFDIAFPPSILGQPLGVLRHRDRDQALRCAPDRPRPRGCRMRQAERFVALSAAKVDRQKGEATLSFADYRGKAEADTPPSLNVVTVRMVRRGESWAMTGDPVYSSP